MLWQPRFSSGVVSVRNDIFSCKTVTHSLSQHNSNTAAPCKKKKVCFENLISVHYKVLIQNTCTGDKDTDFRKENGYYCKLVSSLVVLCLTDEHTISSDPLMPISAMSDL